MGAWLLKKQKNGLVAEIVRTFSLSAAAVYGSFGFLVNISTCYQPAAASLKFEDTDDNDDDGRVGSL